MHGEDETHIHGPHDHPVIAALAGCVILVAAILLLPRLTPPQPHATLLGAGAAAGFMLWLVGFVVTIRHSTALWKLGSLIVLLLAGVIAGNLANGQYEARARADPSSFAEIEFGPEGGPILPRDAATRGPISRLFTESVQANATERRAYSDALGKFGVGNLNSPYLLAQNPQAIARCGDMDGIRTLARQNATRRAAHTADIARAIDAATLDSSHKDALRLIASPPTRDDPLLANQLASVGATMELCTLLAKRSWFNDNAYFGFNNGGDAARYKAIQARRSALASEGEQIDRANTARMKQGLEKLRALLS